MNDSFYHNTDKRVECGSFFLAGVKTTGRGRKMDNSAFAEQDLKFKTIGVAGLGLIGGSMAKTIREKYPCKLLGYDKRNEVNDYLDESGFLDGVLGEDNIGECDLIIVALYPGVTVDYVKSMLPYIQKGSIVTDCCGIKKAVCDSLSKECASYGVRFVGAHPMAGIEKSGYDYSFAGLFDNASMILCRDEYTDENAIGELSEFYLKLGFGQIKESNPVEHDRVIAYTSQLAHVVSGAYIKGSTCDTRYGFSAGSFKDMTRVAFLNETMWTELFLENGESLSKEIAELILHLDEFKEAIDNNDRDKLFNLLKEGRLAKENDERKEQIWKEKFM